jgi:hypothetical protein
MRFRKSVPVLSLVDRQRAGSLTERTGILECRENRLTNELRAIFDPLDCLQQRAIGLKRYYFRLFLHIPFLVVCSPQW